MARMSVGIGIAHTVARHDRSCKPAVDSGGAEADFGAVDLDELFPSKPADPLTLFARQDLDPLSVDELHARIAALEEEIARSRARIEFATHHRASAENLFKK
jgi:uncharacterized small protein (DUF1192 family)